MMPSTTSGVVSNFSMPLEQPFDAQVLHVLDIDLVQPAEPPAAVVA
jgi:hypothetical protein